MTIRAMCNARGSWVQSFHVAQRGRLSKCNVTVLGTSQPLIDYTATQQELRISGYRKHPRPAPRDPLPRKSYVFISIAKNDLWICYPVYRLFDDIADAPDLFCNIALTKFKKYCVCTTHTHTPLWFYSPYRNCDRRNHILITLKPMPRIIQTFPVRSHLQHAHPLIGTR